MKLMVVPQTVQQFKVTDLGQVVVPPLPENSDWELIEKLDSKEEEWVWVAEMLASIEEEEETDAWEEETKVWVWEDEPEETTGGPRESVPPGSSHTPPPLPGSEGGRLPYWKGCRPS